MNTAYINATCKIGQSEPCGREATYLIAVTEVADTGWSTEGRLGGVVAMCDYHARTPIVDWQQGAEGESPADVLDGTGVTANTWQSAARRLADEIKGLRESIAQEIEKTRDEHEADDKAEGCDSRFCAGWLLGQSHAAQIARGGCR